MSLRVPLTGGTRRLMDRAAFARMHRRAILVNTVHGPLVDEVDEAALRAALGAGHLAGAGLDVRAEGPRATPGLAALPMVVVTSRVAAGTGPGAEPVQDARAGLGNIRRVGRGRAPTELPVAG